MSKAMRVLLAVLAAASAAALERAGPPKWATALKNFLQPGFRHKVLPSPTLLFSRDHFTRSSTLQRTFSELRRNGFARSYKNIQTDAKPSGTFVASGTYVVPVGQIQKGSYLMIKGRPCRCVEVSPGSIRKPGHAHIVAIDIFTGQKLEDFRLTWDFVDVPFVTLTAFQVMDANEQTGEVVLRKEDGDTKVDLKLPMWTKLRELTEDDDEILKALADGTKAVSCVVQSACGEEKIVELRLGNAD